jgi:glycosyltransferase involved in cell wall biosynthesis
MKILFIAPLPPPITGHSLASEVLRDGLTGAHEVATVDLSVGSNSDGSVTTRRLVEVAKVLREVRRNRRGADAVYLTISESVAGNLKDLAIYLACAGLLGRTCIHLHGGSIKRLLFDRHPLLRRVNAAFLRRVGGAIISGRAHEQIFGDMLDARRLHIVPNFAADELFVSEAAVAEKFRETHPLRVLYLSGMHEEKGYGDLVDAYLALPDGVRGAIRLDFAGRFATDRERSLFEAKIAHDPGVRYHGLVDDARKRELFAQAHVFCLPTAMFEGQPISILEAYASGCVVVTTGQAGIRDVFQDGVHGLEIEPRSPASIGAALERLVADRGALAAIGAANRREAESAYRTTTYTSAVRAILEALGVPGAVGRPASPAVAS